MKKPPFSRLLIERRAITANTWWVLLGFDAWQTANAWSQPSNRHRPFTLCPPGQDPNHYDWRAYRNAPAPVGLVRCGNVDGDQLRQLVTCLLRAGVQRVYDLFADLVYEVAK